MLNTVKGYISQLGSNLSSKGCEISFLSEGVSFVSLTKQKCLPILRQEPSSLLLLNKTIRQLILIELLVSGLSYHKIPFRRPSLKST